MAPNPLILDAQALKRLPVPNTAITQMPSGPLPVPASVIAAPTPNVSLAPMAAPPPSIATPPMPSVIKAPDPAIQNTGARLLGDQAELKRIEDTGSGVSQIKNPFLRGLARVGDVAASVVAPGVAAAIPGTTNHHNFLINQEVGRVNNDLGNQQEQAQTTLLDAQPQLKQMGLENQELRTQGVIQHQQDQAQHYKDQVEGQLRAQGYKHDATGKVVPLAYEEMSPQQQALHDYRVSRQEEADAQTAYKNAQKDNIPVQIDMARQRIENAQRNSDIAAQRLGLSKETQALNEDKYYNPQPTAQERRVGDLGQSAVNQVRTMRQVMNAHPEVFGPLAGRTLRAQEWLGSQSPDAQRFLSASRYLADHSAGVFGSRSVEITKALEQLTDPKINSAAMEAALDQAETTAQHFVDAGKVHGKPNTPASGNSSGKPDFVFVPGKGLVKQ